MLGRECQKGLLAVVKHWADGICRVGNDSSVLRLFSCAGKKYVEINKIGQAKQLSEQSTPTRKLLIVHCATKQVRKSCCFQTSQAHNSQTQAPMHVLGKRRERVVPFVWAYDHIWQAWAFLPCVFLSVLERRKMGSQLGMFLNMMLSFFLFSFFFLSFSKNTGDV